MPTTGDHHRSASYHDHGNGDYDHDHHHNYDTGDDLTGDDHHHDHYPHHDHSGGDYDYLRPPDGRYLDIDDLVRDDDYTAGYLAAISDLLTGRQVTLAGRP